jgi:hypothetical protein
MNKSENVKELAIALSKAQAEMPPAEMKSVNPFFKSKYADLGSVIKAAKPVMAKHGLSISQLPTSLGDMLGVTTILMHESGEWIEDTIMLPINEEKGKSAAQVAGSVISYLRRYSFASILGMYADEDIDGNAPPQSQKKKTTRKPRQSKKETNADVFQAVVEAGIVDNLDHAKQLYQNYCRTGYADLEDALAWGKAYRGWRDTDLTPQEAAEKANAGEFQFPRIPLSAAARRPSPARCRCPRSTASPIL